MTDENVAAVSGSAALLAKAVILKVGRSMTTLVWQGNLNNHCHMKQYPIIPKGNNNNWHVTIYILTYCISKPVADANPCYEQSVVTAVTEEGNAATSMTAHCQMTLIPQ